MNVLNEFSIPLLGLKDGAHEFNFQIDEHFFKLFEASPIQKGQIAVKMELDKRPDNIVLDFHFDGSVQTECDRCLEPFDFPIGHQAQLLVKMGETEKEEADIIYLLTDTPELNVAKYIYELISLSLPISKFHDHADMDCDPEMLKYLEKEQNDAPEEKKSIWDALKNFDSDQ